MIAIDIPVIAACTNNDKCPDGWFTCTAAATALRYQSHGSKYQWK
jgi:hypothetical protein